MSYFTGIHRSALMSPRGSVIDISITFSFDLASAVCDVLHRYQNKDFTASLFSCYSCYFPLCSQLALATAFSFPRLQPIYWSRPTIAFFGLTTKTLRLLSLATKDPFQKLVSDTSPSVKYSLKPLPWLASNESHNPHLLPFCKNLPSWSEGSIVWLFWGFVSMPQQSSVWSSCACHCVHGSKKDKVEASNPSAWPFHPLTHTLPLIC